MPPRHIAGIKSVAGVLAWLSACAAAGAVGALPSSGARSLYSALVQPGWAPPGWLFGPVWSVLYAMMAVAAWRVWNEPQSNPFRSRALVLFGVQLLANALWSWLFFAWRLGGVAFAEILLLWLLIAATLVVFWRISRAAALLLVPCLLWVTFASALNLALWRLNPGLLG